MAELQLLGYRGGQQVLNDRRIVLTQHTGPASYTQITPGTPPAAPTGGDTINAKDCGLEFIEGIMVCGDSSGTYSGHAFQPAVSLNGVGAAAKTVPLMWTVAATGAQVAGATNLSAVQLEILVFGM
jgi:hypothetical protein